jgi:hypothetical protein
MSEPIKWTSVYKSLNRFEAEVIKGNIENEGIPCVIINKQDSSYLSIVPGMIELHVPILHKEQALTIITQQQKEEKG